MKKDKDEILEDTELTDSEEQKESKFKHFWDYVTDYKRKTVTLALPSVVFDIVYAGFLSTMAILSLSLWPFIMSIYHFLLCMLRINILYRAGRGAIFKGRRFSERVNYRKFSRNLILLDGVFAFAVYLIVKVNVVLRELKALVSHVHVLYGMLTHVVQRRKSPAAQAFHLVCNIAVPDIN